ncbi:MAG: hypothetical protein HC872_08320 [Gammaproteobacteria bacterium]|nr:hypothetical protein [Gammaproteobacteria bacterium]
MALHSLPALSQTSAVPSTAQASTGDARPAGVIVHRARAGIQDANGWSIAASTRGDFAVRVPCLFNDFSLQGSETLASIEAIGCRAEDQRKYSASRFEYRQAAAARKYFEDISGPRRIEGETARRRIMFNGFPAVEVDFNSSSRCGTTRSVLVGATVMQLTVAGPASACSSLGVRAASFFASLRVTLRETG